MAQQGLDIAPPPRKKELNQENKTSTTKRKPTKVANARARSSAITFNQMAESDKVQFNKRVTQATADGFEILAIKTKKKVPDLIAEGLELLEAKYGKV